MKQRYVFFAWLIVFAGLAATAWAQAAGGAPAPAAGTVAATTGKTMTLMDMWKVGGAFMWPILFLSIGGVALIVYVFLFCRDEKMIQTSLLPSVRDAVYRCDYAQAAAVCQQNPGVMANVLAAGFQRLHPDALEVSRVEKAMEEAAVEENTAGLKPIIYLSVIAQLAPMFGLLGTVSGMIKAFQKIGLGAMGDPEKLATDIGEAMITTAFGLIVGIPAMFFYFQLKGKFQGNMARLARVAGDLTHDVSTSLVRVQQGVPATFYSPAAPVPVAPAPAGEEHQEG